MKKEGFKSFEDRLFDQAGLGILNKTPKFYIVSNPFSNILILFRLDDPTTKFFFGKSTFSLKRLYRLGRILRNGSAWKWSVHFFNCY